MIVLIITHAPLFCMDIPSLSQIVRCVHVLIVCASVWHRTIVNKLRAKEHYIRTGNFIRVIQYTYIYTRCVCMCEGGEMVLRVSYDFVLGSLYLS